MFRITMRSSVFLQRSSYEWCDGCESYDRFAMAIVSFLRTPGSGRVRTFSLRRFVSLPSPCETWGSASTTTRNDRTDRSAGRTVHPKTCHPVACSPSLHLQLLFS